MKDEFSNLPISRQRKYQLRKKKLGLCQTCGKNLQNYKHKCDKCMSLYLKKQVVRRKYKTRTVKQEEIVENKPKWKYVPKKPSYSDGAKLLSKLNMDAYYQTNDMSEEWTR